MKRLLMLAGVLLGAAALSVAAPVSCIGTWTLAPLASYSNGTTLSDIGAFSGSPTDQCTAYGDTFSNFSIYFNAGFTSTPFSMTVTFNSNGDIHFGSSEGPGQDINLQYEISPGILGMTLSSGGSAGTSVLENICSTQQPFPGGSCGGTLLGSGSVTGPTSTFISVTGSAHDWVFKDISGTSTFDQTVIPEPMTYSLMGAGLLGLGLLGRRLRRK